MFFKFVSKRFEEIAANGLPKLWTMSWCWTRIRRYFDRFGGCERKVVKKASRVEILFLMVKWLGTIGMGFDFVKSLPYFFNEVY